MTEPARHDRRNGALLASVAFAALLALAAAWISALARVPQQRAAVERLLRAQTGLDVRYDRLVVRLGFYGPEAEFSNVEMLRPGAAAPLLRAPRMVARFESWRLLRGGQLRPGRVLVTGAELDLRQLVDLRRGIAAAAGPGATRDAPIAAASGEPPDAFAALEAQLPALLGDIPEGSLDFEAATLVWTDPARLAEPLLLRAPRLFASRRVDGAQFSATLLLPTRFGRTLFVAATLRHGARQGAPFDGRLRLAGRGLALERWRQLGLLPESLARGSGDATVSLQWRDGRVQRADGEVQLAGLGLVTPAPVIARQLGSVSAGFDFSRLPGGAWRWRLRDVLVTAAGASGGPFAGRGSLELRREPGRAAMSLQARRLPIEFVALLSRGAGSAGAAASQALRVEAGEIEELESHWAHDGSRLVVRGRVGDVALASIDRLWRAAGLAVQVDGNASHWRFALQGAAVPWQAPGLEAVPQPPRAALHGTVELALAPDGWSLALRDAALRWPDGPVIGLSGSAGRDAQAREASHFELALTEPLPRASMALPQSALGRWLPASFWAAFVAGRVETAQLEIEDGVPRSAALALREVAFAGDQSRPASSNLALDLGWDGRRVEGRLSGGQVGPLRLESGRLLWREPGDVPGRSGLELEARLLGSVADALQLAGAGSLPGGVPAAGFGGRARIDARLRPATEAAPRSAATLDYVLEIEDGHWRPLAATAPLGALRGRVRADARGLRDARLEGRWLGGPVQLRLRAGPQGELRLAASGRVARSALEREWSWIELAGHDGLADLDWSAELRPETAAPLATRPRRAAARGAADLASGGATPWRMRVALADAAAAELHWLPPLVAADGWRLERGVVHFGNATLPSAIPGAVVVGGAVERIELAGLAGALGRVASGEGWQRPLVGELRAAAVAVGAVSLGPARLRLAGSRDSTSVELDGPALAGELRQAHAPRAPLQARFARLGFAEDAPLASLADAFVPVSGVLELQVADLRRGARSLGELQARFESDGAAIATRDLTLRRGAQRLGASGRCERATLACSAAFTLADAELEDLQRDLGEAPRVQGREATAVGRIGWSMRRGSRFAATLQGELEFGARLEGRVPALAVAAATPDAATASSVAAGSTAAAASAATPAVDAAAGSGAVEGAAGQDASPTWSLLAPLVAAVTAQRGAQSVDGTALAVRSARGAVAPLTPAAIPAGTEESLALERLELRLSIHDGVATVERYDAIGRAARLDVAGRFDFRDDHLEQQAEWHWIAPGVAGAVDRLDPRSPLATGLRTLRELVARRDAAVSAPSADAVAAVARVDRFQLQGPLRQPRIRRAPLLDSPR